MEPEDVKAEIYDAMALINRAFQQITEGMTRLRKQGVLEEYYVSDQQTITSELCAKMNCHILVAINAREDDDRRHYGKLRTGLEKRTKR